MEYYYGREFPNKGENVIIYINNIHNSSIYVKLPEFNNIDAMIHLNELSRRSYIKSMNKVVKIGTFDVAQIEKIDNKNIDLCKKLLTQDDITKAKIKYEKAKKVITIIKSLKERLAKNINENDLYKEICYPLYHIYDDIYDIFINNLNIISSKYTDHLIEIIQNKNTIKQTTIRAKIKLNCFTMEGIDAIKYILENDNNDIKIKYVVAPIYIIYTKSYDIEHGIQLIENKLKTIEEKSKMKNAILTIEEPPKPINIINIKDELLNTKLDELKELYEQNIKIFWEEFYKINIDYPDIGNSFIDNWFNDEDLLEIINNCIFFQQHYNLFDKIITKIDVNKYELLMLSIVEKNDETSNKLINIANINMKTDGNYPILKACYDGSWKIVEMLLNKDDININVINDEEKSIINCIEDYTNTYRDVNDNGIIEKINKKYYLK